MMNTEDAITFGETKDLPIACATHVTNSYYLTGPGPNPPYTDIYSDEFVLSDANERNSPFSSDSTRLFQVDFVGTPTKPVNLAYSKEKSDY